MIYTDRYTVSGPGLANFSFPEDQALLIVGDSHGQSKALRGLLDGLGRFSTPGKRRTLVFLGDFIDRGPDSIGCLEAALNEGADRANADDEVDTPGNHELLLADTIEDVAAGNLMSSAGQTWLRNGGLHFLESAWEASGRPMPAIADAILGLADMLPHPGHDTFVDMVRSWPSHFAMGDALCVHAGILPKKPHSYTLDLPQDTHLGKSALEPSAHGRHWAWIRDDFLGWQGGWPEDGKKSDGKSFRGKLVVHGHTVPQRCSPYMETSDDLRKVFCRMATNARICVDGGSARNVGVAGAVLTSDGVRIAFEPT